MKTPQKVFQAKASNIQKIHGIILSLTCMLLLFSTSCKKNDLMAPALPKDKDTERKADILPRLFTMIEIDHNSGFTSAPDYLVSVRSDGLVTYEGRANVVKDTVQVNITSDMVKKLASIFDFPSISAPETSEIASRLEPISIPEHERVTTTYRNGRDLPKIYVDYNTGYPIDVVYRRKKVEELLQISKYIRKLPKMSTAINPVF